MDFNKAFEMVKCRFYLSKILTYYSQFQSLRKSKRYLLQYFDNLPKIFKKPWN